MHVQFVRFQLRDMNAKEYAEITEKLAPAFAEVPGLDSKVWLADPSTGTYGGVYFWNDRAAMEKFSKTELFHSVATHPRLKDLTSTDYEVMDAPTRVTRGDLVAG